MHNVVTRTVRLWTVDTRSEGELCDPIEGLGHCG